MEIYIKINSEEKIQYGLKLKKYRENLKLTQKDVVKKAKKFVDKIYKDENGKLKKYCFIFY